MAERDELKAGAYAINIILALIAVAAFILTLPGTWGIWGVDYLISVPLPVRTILVALLLALAIPAVGRKAASFSEKAVKALTIKSDVYLFVALIILYIAAAIVLRSQNHALGDGHNVLGNIGETGLVKPTEPLECYLHLWSFKAFAGKVNVATIYYFWSIVAGIGLMVILRAFVKGIGAYLITLAIAFTFGTMQYFFGYAEHYTLAFVFGVLFLLSGSRDLERGKLSPLTFIALILAVASHLYSLILFPAAAFLIWRIYGKKIGIAALVVTAAIYAATFVLGGRLLGHNLFQLLAPITETANNPYDIFSLGHLLDMLNLAVLAYPLIFALFFIPIEERASRIFILIALAGTWLFSFAIDPTLGAGRDWDLLALAAAPTLALFVDLVCDYERRERKSIYLLLAPAVIFSMFHTGGWILHNSSTAQGYDRVKHMVATDIHYSPKYFEGYRNKAWAVITETRYNDIEEAIRASELRYAIVPTDTMTTMSLCRKYLVIGDTARTVELASRHYKDFIGNQGAVPQLAEWMILARRYGLAERMYLDYLATGRKEFGVYANLALCMQIRGQIDSSIMMAQIAVGFPEATLDYRFEYYLRFIIFSRYDLALDGLKQIRPQISQAYWQFTDQLVDALEQSNYARADSMAKIMLGASARAASKSKSPG